MPVSIDYSNAIYGPNMLFNLRPPLWVLVRSQLLSASLNSQRSCNTQWILMANPVRWRFSHSRIVEYSCCFLATGKTAKIDIHFVWPYFLRSVFTAFSITDIEIYIVSPRIWGCFNRSCWVIKVWATYPYRGCSSSPATPLFVDEHINFAVPCFIRIGMNSRVPTVQSIYSLIRFHVRNWHDPMVRY